MVRTVALRSCSRSGVIDISFELNAYPRRHCEPTGRRKAPPDDRLREAIQKRLGNSIASSHPPSPEGGLRRTRVLLAMTIISIRRHMKPERVFDDAEAHLAAERHQRFRVKLHAADRQGLVLDHHRHAVL